MYNVKHSRAHSKKLHTKLHKHSKVKAQSTQARHKAAKEHPTRLKKQGLRLEAKTRKAGKQKGEIIIGIDIKQAYDRKHIRVNEAKKVRKYT